ncbi:hypothetical protein ASE23_26700 [Rhizobium sp. Root73]|uniref:hypothetical protein n=1 Tax=unclassified Rhizobium TaxID=2613769 RepID=UPI000729D4DA|nr:MULTISPECIES: hypothetical protein [unclassified Rhizobium]KQY15071.1 hypothetical protein ASD36_26155 [Rhizobium sp. Root1334]KRC06502.1 hypothetical protein ASE23_26700 [Rhizobium sp. Root73]
MARDTSPCKILIIGQGVLGGDVLDFLLQSGANIALSVGARNPEKAAHRVNLARYTAMNLGHTAPVDILPADLMNIEATAELIDRLKPDIIFNATTLHSWWVITKLPTEAFKKLDDGRGGIWTPLHQVLIRRLMTAVRLANSQATVVNASYPDVVNATLAAEGLAPAVGIGNIANAVPGIRLAAAHMLGVDPIAIEVRFFAQHYVSYRMPSTGGTDGAPYHLTVYVNGREVQPSEIDHDTLFSLVAGRFRRIKGLAGQSVTASSATAMLLALSDRTGQVVHGPGPMGLVGGYPVRISPKGLLIDLPSTLTLDEAIDINRQCQRFDGIESVDEDGTVRFTQKAAGVLRDVLNYDCDAYRPEECEARAEELAARFAEYARANGMPQNDAA